MGYKFQIQKRIDLSDLGADNNGNPFFAEVKNMNALPYQEKMEYLQSVSEVYGGMDIEKVQQGDISSFKIDAKKLSAVKETLRRLIVSWNLVDFDDKPVNIQDQNALDRVPGVVVDRISGALQDAEEAEQVKNS